MVKAMPHRPLTRALTIIVALVIVWCLVLTFLYIGGFNITEDNQLISFQYEQRLQMIADQVDKLESEYRNEIRSIRKEIAGISKGVVNQTIHHESTPIAVLIMACNRETVTRAINSVLKYRPSVDKFPIIVSQDCGHEKTAKAISYYKNKLTHIMQQPDTSDITLPKKERRMAGYYKISRHYKWALSQVFDIYGYKLTVIIEDDLEVSPDFFSYMEATSSLLMHDKTLMCVSAWNDNGKKELIDITRHDLLYRSDFFPGLGWMLTVDLWQELKPKWPLSYWDDWLRLNAQRQGRSCIRPEISRTMTFGRIGVSKGENFNKHLKYIILSDKIYDFNRANLSYLLKDSYETYFVHYVNQLPVVSLNDALAPSQNLPHEVAVVYTDDKQFTKFAERVGLMSDLKDGVPRTGYKGIVTFYKNGHRVYLIPYRKQ